MYCVQRSRLCIDDFSIHNFRGQWDLSSSLQVHMNEGDVYVHTNMFKDGKPSKSQKMKNKKQEDELMKQSVLTGEAEKQHTLPPYSESFNQLKKQRKVAKTLNY